MDQDREFAHEVVRARRILLAKVVYSMQLGPVARRRTDEMQALIEAWVYTIPVQYRTIAWLDKHVLGPATRVADRLGYAEIARQLKGWVLT